MPVIGHDGTVLLLPSILKERYGPDLHCRAFPARSDMLSIGRPCHRIHIVGMSSIGENGATGRGFPHLYGFVEAGRGNVSAIRRPRYCAYTAAMSAVGNNRASSHGFPYLHRLIITS